MDAVVPMLEESLVWDESGHLAECAVSALADGELTLLAADAVQHAEVCAVCSARVGEATLFALEVAAALAVDPRSARVLAPEPVSRLAQRVTPRPPEGLPAPLPIPAVIGALVLAVVGGAPWLCSFEQRTPSSLAAVLAVLGRLMARVMETARTPGLSELAWFAAAVLAVCGVAVARLAARARARLPEGMPQ